MTQSRKSTLAPGWYGHLSIGIIKVSSTVPGTENIKDEIMHIILPRVLLSLAVPISQVWTPINRGFLGPYFQSVNHRAWQINEINGINEINEGLINLCKLDPGLMQINDGLMWINGTLTFRHLINPINALSLLIICYLFGIAKIHLGIFLISAYLWSISLID